MNNTNSTTTTGLGQSTTINLGQSYGCTCSHVVHVTKESNLLVTYCSRCGKILDYAQVNTNYFGCVTTPPTISGSVTGTIVSKDTTDGIYRYDTCGSLHEI